MTAKIKIKKLISRTKFESAQKDATELHSVVERLGLMYIQEKLRRGEEHEKKDCERDNNQKSSTRGMYMRTKFGYTIKLE